MSAEYKPQSGLDRYGYFSVPPQERSPESRIVVTGLGLITPLGLDTDTTWNNMLAGKIGISKVDIPHASMSVAGVIEDFDPSNYLFIGKDVKRMSRPVQMATVATFEALMQAGLIDENGKLVDGIENEAIGVEIGTGMGNWHYVTDVSKNINDDKKVGPFDMLQLQPERVASGPSRKFELRGPLNSDTAACATGKTAIINGFSRIAMGDADVMVVGGAEAAINEVLLTVFGRALSDAKDPQQASLPLNKRRSGFVPAEGAGILVLERESHARERGAKILARIASYAMGADADTDTAPNQERVTQVLQTAMRRAGIKENDYLYVNAHATATETGDPIELKAIRTAVGEDRVPKVTLNAPKSLIGHGVGAAGGTEAVLTVKSLSEGITFPTAGLHEEDRIEESSSMNLPLGEAQNMHEGIQYAIDNSFGFGGIDAVLVLEKVNE